VEGFRRVTAASVTRAPDASLMVPRKDVLACPNAAIENARKSAPEKNVTKKLQGLVMFPL
jgi:hypothetical protein